MVLKIENRTENWKTARCLQPFFGDLSVRLACELGEPLSTPTADVKLELYWKGVRDWCAAEGGKQKCEGRLVESYRKLFPDLRQRIERYGRFRHLCPRHYDYEVSEVSTRALLVNNLVNTEIDIVLESPKRLYIGEAKYKSGFHADGKLVLVHQLVRQYVMAKVLVDVLGCDREVIPFVVTEGAWGGSRAKGDVGKLAEPPHQVRFMLCQGWMSARNCLTWDALARMASERPHVGPE